MLLKPPRRLELAVAIIGSLLFAGAYSRLPLFSGNQNTYFLWGLARAGFGHLSSDWLINQTDPVPVFSALVYLVERAGARWVFYALHGLLVAAYALSLFALVRHVLPRRSSVASMAVAVALTTHIHVPSVWDGWVESLAGGLAPALTMPGWFSAVLTEGVAEQYILGAWLQPSAFGVLLLVALAMFALRHELPAVGFAALAAAMHPTYLLQAGILVAGFLAALSIEKRWREALRVSVLALLLLVPLGLFVLSRLGPTGADAREAALSVLYSQRIPYHADVTVWSGARDLWRLVLIAGAILLLWRRERLRAVTLTAATCALLLTVIQLWSGNEALGLMFPWRASVWLTPAATVVIVASGVSFLSSFTRARLGERRTRVLSRAIVLCAAAFVLAASVRGVRGTVHSALEGPLRPPVCGYVTENTEPGLTYLVPLGFEGFRLETGEPIFVDWKSHPYRDSELVEWRDRVGLTSTFYAADSADAAMAALHGIRDASPITHVIAGGGTRRLLEGTSLRLIYEDAYHAVFAVPGAVSH